MKHVEQPPQLALWGETQSKVWARREPYYSLHGSLVDRFFLAACLIVVFTEAPCMYNRRLGDIAEPISRSKLSDLEVDTDQKDL